MQLTQGGITIEKAKPLTELTLPLRNIKMYILLILNVYISNWCCSKLVAKNLQDIYRNENAVSQARI